MTNDCDRYLEDPEAHAAHAQTCASCRSLDEALDLGDVEVPSRPVSLDALPMASWEGAKHRTWPLVIAGVVAAAILAFVFWTAAGVSSPVATVSTTVPPLDALLKMLQLTGKGVGGPAVAVLFVVINSILFLLLRRAPKGIDV